MSALPKLPNTTPLDEAMERICKPSPDAQWVLDQSETLARQRAEQDAQDAQMLAFRESMEREDTVVQQKAYFGNDYQALLDGYESDEYERVRPIHQGFWDEADKIQGTK